MLPKYCIILAIFFKYGICGHGRNISRELNGTITGNQTLTHAEGPYLVTSDLVVAENATLAIEPGTQVNFLPSVGIRVHGSLNAKGTPSHRITFRAVPCKDAPSCKNSAIPYNQGIRLVGGTSHNNGRLELQWRGQWGTVCGQYFWDMRDTRVACRQLGFLGAKRYYFHPGSGRVYMKFVECTGYEESLWDCRYSWAYYYPCDQAPPVHAGLEICSSSAMQSKEMVMRKRKEPQEHDERNDDVPKQSEEMVMKKRTVLQEFDEENDDVPKKRMKNLKSPNWKGEPMSNPKTEVEFQKDLQKCSVEVEILNIGQAPSVPVNSEMFSNGLIGTGRRVAKRKETLRKISKQQRMRKKSYTKTRKCDPVTHFLCVKKSSINDVMLEIGPFELTVGDLWTLVPPHVAEQHSSETSSINGFVKGWLLDKVVVALLWILTQQYDGVSGAYYNLAESDEGRPNARLQLLGESFSNITRIVVPFIVLKSHWNLLVLDKTTETRYFFDPSARNVPRKISPSTDPSLASLIDEISKAADTKTGWRSRKWRCIEPMHFQQNDDHNCGPLICYFAMCLCEGTSLVAKFDGEAERARMMEMLFRFC